MTKYVPMINSENCISVYVGIGPKNAFIRIAVDSFIEKPGKISIIGIFDEGRITVPPPALIMHMAPCTSKVSTIAAVD